jgi:monofunctional biosynthetic peptidoglycan transglycosylase
VSRKPKARPKSRSKAASPRRGPVRRVVGWALLALLLVLLIGPVAVVTIYRFVPPPMTFLMVERLFQGHGFDRRWVPLRAISPRLVGSLIAAEDSGFCRHHGFDLTAIHKAMVHNEQGGKVRGGSTISQQTAKNVFLWPHRDYVRKGLEAWFTVLIETVWGKPRIMEVYLNSIEWGPGIYGAEAAAQHNFHVSASQLSPQQAARLAAIVPKPLSWKAAAPGRYVRKRSGTIAARATVVRRDDLASCVY